VDLVSSSIFFLAAASASAFSFATLASAFLMAAASTSALFFAS